MNDFHKEYKKKPAGFTSSTTGRLVRAEKQEARRKANRTANFLRHRDVPDSFRQQVTSSPAMSDPAKRLERWRVNREIKRKKEQQRKKPVFKVGIVHHRFYSPIANEKVNSKPEPCHGRRAIKEKCHPTPPKRITRATQKRLDAKNAETTTPAAPSTSKSTLTRSQTKSSKKKLLSQMNLCASFAPAGYAFTIPTTVQGLPLFGRYAIDNESPSMSPNIKEENKHNGGDESLFTTNIVPSQRKSTRIRGERKSNSLFRQDAIDIEKHEITGTSLSEKHIENTKTNEIRALPIVESDKTEAIETPDVDPPRPGSPAPATFSPYITMSRGKDSARKERRSKMGISRTPPDDIPTKETVMQNLNISIEEEERTAQYFKFILQREIDRLTELCTQWDIIKNEPDLSEDAQLRINQAIGQTNLLIKKKFERFRSLVLDCETGKGEMLVQCRDLQGFWDMMYMEVKDCELRFLKLDMLRSKNWVEDDDIDIGKKKKRERKKKSPVQCKPKMTAKSSVRSWILERKKMSRSEDSSDNVVIVANGDQKQKPSISETMATPREQNSRRSMRKLQQNSVTNRTTPKSISKKTPSSLRKRVQLSEVSKNIRSPLTVMKISKMCKTPEIRLDDTISYINSDQTPGKGILKKSEDSSGSDSVLQKSMRKVDFNEELALNEVPIDEHLQNSIDLGHALASIDSYDSDGSDNVFDEPNDVVDEMNGDARTIRVEKRLDFEDESFNEAENTNTGETVAAAVIPEAVDIPVIKFTLPTPSRKGDSSKSSPQTSSKRSTRRSKVFTELDENAIMEEQLSSSIGPKVLRNRVVAPTTPKDHRGSRKSLQNDTNGVSLNLSIKENDDPQRARKMSEMEKSQIGDIEHENYDQTKKRRSTRKSIGFNGKDSSFAFSMMKREEENDDPQRARKMSEMEKSQIGDIEHENYDQTKKRRSTRKSIGFNGKDSSFTFS